MIHAERDGRCYLIVEFRVIEGEGCPQTSEREGRSAFCFRRRQLRKQVDPLGLTGLDCVGDRSLDHHQDELKTTIIRRNLVTTTLCAATYFVMFAESWLVARAIGRMQRNSVGGFSFTAGQEPPIVNFIAPQACYRHVANAANGHGHPHTLALHPLVARDETPRGFRAALTAQEEVGRYVVLSHGAPPFSAIFDNSAAI